MDSGELIDLFYNRAYEKFVNKQILDDKNYIVPRQQLKNYVNELVNIPYIDFINYIKHNQIEEDIKASDITQFSSFSACGIEMCNALIWANNPGCQFIDIGRFFPNNIIGRSDGAYRRYGESHIKAATQLGLTFEYYGYWYLSCLGYIYPDLDEDVRKHLLARTITRNRLYQRMLIDILDHDVNPLSYINNSYDSTFRRTFYSVSHFFNICLEECKKQNIRSYQIKGRTINCRMRHNGLVLDDSDYEQSIHFDSFLNEIARYPLCSIDEEIELVFRYQRGDKKACKRLIESNLRFVVSVAKTYRNQGLELQDLIQEGTIGLINAIEHFDYTRGIRFIKYAVWWIRLSITKALITQPYLVQIPYSTITIHRKVRDFIDTFEQKQGYLPSVDEIDINESTDIEWLNYICQLPADLKKTTCLIGDFDVYESSGPKTDDFQEAEYNSYFINRQLRCLDNRKSTILRKYFGLEGNPEGETLGVIGDYLGLTRERVRQIVEESIRQLRDMSGIKREEAKIGDVIRLDSSEQVGKVVNIKQSPDGSTMLMLKMDAGNTEEVLASDSSYEILPRRITKIKPASQNPSVVLKAMEKKQKHLTPSEKTQDETDTQRIVNIIDGIKVGDRLVYNGKECIIQKILSRGSSSRFLVEYSNGVLDYVPNDKSKYRIVHTPSNPQYETSKERKNESAPKPQVGKEASVGDRIVYNSKPCLVLDKSKKYNVIRLKVRYDDGKIDNVLGEQNRYVILYRHDNAEKRELSQPVQQKKIVKEVVLPKRKEEPTLTTRKSREELYCRYTELIMKINQAIVHGKKVLAKPALLVAVIDNISCGKIQRNRVTITASLEEKYNTLLSKYTGKSLFERLTSIAMPFWHLQSDKFWFLEPPYPNAKNFSPSKKWLIDNIKYARLDDDLWYLLQDEAWRNKLRNFIIEKKLLDESTSPDNSAQSNISDRDLRSERIKQPKFLITTSLNDLVRLGIITNKQLKHCYKKGLRTIGDVKNKIEYYHLTPDSTRFTKYTLDMWFGIVGLLNSNE